MKSSAKNFLQNSWLILLPLVLCFAAYSFMLSAPFKTLDDEFVIEKNEAIRSFANTEKIFRSSFFGGDAYYRPLVTLSHAVEYHFFKLDSFYYNLTNVLFHMATTLLVFALLRFLTKKPVESLLIASLFAIHPVHWEAVGNIAGRSIILCGFFNMAAFFLYCLFKKEGKRRYLALSLGSFLLALLSKESAGVFPALLIAYEWFLGGFKLRQWQKLVPVIAPFAVVELVYILWRHSLGITKLFYWRNIGENILGFITFLHSVFTDIRIFLWPLDLHFDRMQKLYLNFSEPGVILTVVAVAVTAAFLIRFWKEFPLIIKFFLCWFVIELLPVSQLLVSIGVQPGYISTAEHFLYTPSVGFFVAFIFGLDILMKKYPLFLKRSLVTAVGCVYFVFLFLITVEQSIYAAHETTMFDRTLNIDPDNSRIRTSLALSYAKQKDYRHAEYHFRKSVESDPYNTRGRIGLGRSLHDQGRYFEALQEFGKIENPEGYEENLRKNLDETYPKLIEAYRARLEQEPNNGRMHYSLGVVYSQKKDDELAVEEYEKAIKLEPDFKEARLNLASTYARLGRVEEAIAVYTNIVDQEGPKDIIDHQAAAHAADLYRKTGNEEKSRYYSEIAESFKN